MIRLSFRLALAALSLALASAGCGSSVTTGSTGTAGAGGGTIPGAGGGTTSASGGGSGGSTTTGAGGAGGSTTTTGAGGAGGSTTTTGAGGSVGQTCGGKGGKPCGAAEFCDFGDNLCGVADGSGTCAARPQSCPDIFQATCGCGGTVYSSECDAYAQGVDLSQLGFCTPPSPELFPCGPHFCDKTTQYCQRTTSDVAGTPDGFQCNLLPGVCNGSGTCACVAGEPCAALCDAATGGVLLTCPGG